MSIALQFALPDEEKKKRYVLAEAYGRANIQNALYYVMEEEDKAILLGSEHCCFGDKVYIIDTGNTYILGNDGKWHPYIIPGIDYRDPSAK